MSFLGGSEHFFPLRLLFRGVSFRRFDAQPAGEEFHRFRELHFFPLHDKSKDISSCAAAETLIHRLRRMNGKGRGFFGMERAKPQEISAPFFQADILSDYFDNIGIVADAVYEFLG